MAEVRQAEKSKCRLDNRGPFSTAGGARCAKLLPVAGNVAATRHKDAQSSGYQVYPG